MISPSTSRKKTILLCYRYSLCCLSSPASPCASDRQSQQVRRRRVAGRRVGGRRSMEWWRRAVVAPVKRACVVLAARLRRKKEYDGRGVLVKLHDDIQTCAYEDVQVMWEIQQRSETARLAAAPPSPGSAWALVWLGHRHRDMDLRQWRRC